jgi:hypothetical protein
MFELRFHNPNQTTFGIESSLNFLANKKKNQKLKFKVKSKKKDLSLSSSSSSSPIKLLSMPKVVRWLLPKKTTTNPSSCSSVSYELELELGFYMPCRVILSAESSSEQLVNKIDQKKPKFELRFITSTRPY